MHDAERVTGPHGSRKKRTLTMKRMALFALLLAMTVGNAGCCFLGCGKVHRTGCRGCGAGACQGGGGYACDEGAGAGATVTYPYYTTRGPRDFFACNPGHPSN